MIALQYWFDFCPTSTGMNRGCTCVPSLLNLLLTSRPFPPLQVITEPSHWKSQALLHVSCSFPEIPSFLFPGSLMGWWPSTLTSQRQHSTFTYYFSDLFFFSQNFCQVWTQGSCKLQKRNEVVDLIPDKSVFLIRGDLLWGPKSSHYQILHVSWCMETVYTCVSNCLLRTCITYMIHKHIDM